MSSKYLASGSPPKMSSSHGSNGNNNGVSDTALIAQLRALIARVNALEKVRDEHSAQLEELMDDLFYRKPVQESVMVLPTRELNYPMDLSFLQQYTDSTVLNSLFEDFQTITSEDDANQHTGTILQDLPATARGYHPSITHRHTCLYINAREKPYDFLRRWLVPMLVQLMIPFYNPSTDEEVEELETDTAIHQQQLLTDPTLERIRENFAVMRGSASILQVLVPNSFNYQAYAEIVTMIASGHSGLYVFAPDQLSELSYSAEEKFVNLVVSEHLYSSRDRQREAFKIILTLMQYYQTYCQETLGQTIPRVYHQLQGDPQSSFVDYALVGHQQQFTTRQSSGNMVNFAARHEWYNSVFGHDANTKTDVGKILKLIYFMELAKQRPLPGALEDELAMAQGVKRQFQDAYGRIKQAAAENNTHALDLVDLLKYVMYE